MLPTTSRGPRRRQSRQVFAIVSTLVLLVLSLSLLHTRLSQTKSKPTLQYDDAQLSSDSNPLLSDSNDDPNVDFDDKIDVSDTLDHNDSDIFDHDIEDLTLKPGDIERPPVKSDGFYFDHFGGAVRRRLNRRAIDELWDYDGDGLGVEFRFGNMGVDGDPSKGAFGSDDVSASEYVRRKVSEVAGVEEALLLKLPRLGGSLREGWGDWFDKKGDFLRRDRMFKSNLDVLNPLSNPMLQDPDGVGGLSRGDKVVHKLFLSEFNKVPFLSFEGTRRERRTLDTAVDEGEGKKKKKIVNVERDGDFGRFNEFSGHIYADGKRWGYYPSLNPWLSFSDFVDAFFREGNCSMRVFMVWNSPAWMYGVRHQRGLESLLSQHPDACVLVFSETVELDFFKDSFVKDGYKVATAMPNLEELLEDTPAHIFASAWLEWRKTKYYSTHYSELVRLVALYKYGGIYLDCDVVVLKSLSWLDNSIGLEDQLTGSSLNGAVMAFGKHSPFIKECLNEFYTTYDDAKLRWNGADLLTRVSKRFQSKELELKIQPSFTFFPVSSHNITRYFTAPVTEPERAKQNALFQEILDQSSTFHFWNSFTSSIIPEAESLVTKILDKRCIHCSDVL